MTRHIYIYIYIYIYLTDAWVITRYKRYNCYEVHTATSQAIQTYKSDYYPNHICFNRSNAPLSNHHKYIVPLEAGSSAMILVQASQLSKCVEEDVVLLDDLDDMSIMQCTDLVRPC